MSSKRKRKDSSTKLVPTNVVVYEHPECHDHLTARPGDEHQVRAARIFFFIYASFSRVRNAHMQEAPARLDEIKEWLLRLPGVTFTSEFEAATHAECRRCHSAEYMAALQAIEEDLNAKESDTSEPFSPRLVPRLFPDHQIHGMTVVSKGSMRAARRAAGAVIAAIDGVLAARGSLANDGSDSPPVSGLPPAHAFCLVRPPGHHACVDGYDPVAEGSGFCLLNSVAIGAAHAVSVRGKRVAMVDFDVHHGNGTENIVRERLYKLAKGTYHGGAPNRSPHVPAVIPAPPNPAQATPQLAPTPASIQPSLVASLTGSPLPQRNLAAMPSSKGESPPKKSELSSLRQGEVVPMPGLKEDSSGSSAPGLEEGSGSSSAPLLEEGSGSSAPGLEDSSGMSSDDGDAAAIKKVVREAIEGALEIANYGEDNTRRIQAQMMRARSARLASQQQGTVKQGPSQEDGSSSTVETPTPKRQRTTGGSKADTPKLSGAAARAAGAVRASGGGGNSGGGGGGQAKKEEPVSVTRSQAEAMDSSSSEELGNGRRGGEGRLPIAEQAAVAMELDGGGGEEEAAVCPPSTPKPFELTVDVNGGNGGGVGGLFSESQQSADTAAPVAMEEEEPGEPAEVYETAKESNVLYCSTHLYEHFDENPDYDFFPGRGGEKPVIDGSKDAEALAKKAAGQPNNAVVDGDGKSCNSKEPVNCKKKEDDNTPKKKSGSILNGNCCPICPVRPSSYRCCGMGGKGAKPLPNTSSVLNMPLEPLWVRRSSRFKGSGPKDAAKGRLGFRDAVTKVLLPKLADFKPDLLLISAGFDGAVGDDGNAQDDVGGLDLTDDDFRWVTRKMLETTGPQCPCVSVLEGGYGCWSEELGTYDRTTLASGAAAHVSALARHAREKLQGKRPS